MEQKITILDIDEFLEWLDWLEEDLEGEANSNYMKEAI